MATHHSWLAASFEIIINYLCTDDVTRYKACLTRTLEERLANGFGIEDIVRVTELMTAETIKAVQEEFANPSQAHRGTSYIRRIRSLSTLGNAIMINIRANYRLLLP